MFRFCAFVLCLSVCIYAWTNEQLIETVEKVCAAEEYICPKEDFGIFRGYAWEWDKEAIIESKEGETFRNLQDLDKSTIQFIKDSFCCVDEECLRHCGIYKKKEIDLINAFPKNAHSLFGLNIPEIQTHRNWVLNYLSKVPYTRKGKKPAELEDFFDAVYFNRDKIRSALNEQKDAGMV